MRLPTGRIVRFGLAAGLATAVAVPLLGDSAYAKGKPATLTLFCQGGASGSATVTLTDNFGPPASNPTTVSCTSGQITKMAIHPTSQPANAFTENETVTDGTNTKTCGPVESTRPASGLSFDCFVDSTGLQLSVS